FLHRFSFEPGGEREHREHLHYAPSSSNSITHTGSITVARAKPVSIAKSISNSRPVFSPSVKQPAQDLWRVLREPAACSPGSRFLSWVRSWVRFVAESVCGIVLNATESLKPGESTMKHAEIFSLLAVACLAMTAFGQAGGATATPAPQAQPSPQP